MKYDWMRNYIGGRELKRFGLKMVTPILSFFMSLLHKKKNEPGFVS